MNVENEVNKVNKANNPAVEDRELLREQLKLLAEKSKSYSGEKLAKISDAMVSIYAILHEPHC